MKILLLLPLTALLAACQTSLPPKTKPPQPDLPSKVVLNPGKATWSSLADVRDAIQGAKGVVLTGSTLDLGGAALDGSKLKRYDDIQDERNTPLRINIPNFSIMNGYVRDIPGGIVVKAADFTVKNATWLSVGEDAVSSIKDQSPRMTIKDCKFFGATDKTIQANSAKDLTIEGCQIFDGITGVRIGTSESKSGSDATKSIKNNTFKNVRTAYNVSRAHVKVSGDKYEGVDKVFVTSNGGTFSSK